MQWLPWQKSKPKRLGLSINTDTLCLVELVLHKQNWKLSNCVYEDLSHSSPTQLNSFLQSYLSQLKCQSNKVALSIDHHHALFKTIELDSTLKEHEILIHIEANSEHYFGCPLNELWIDFTQEIVNKNHFMKIHCVAIKRSRLENTLLLLKTAGLKPIVVELNSDSLLRLLDHLHPKNSDITMVHFTESNYLTITKKTGGEKFINSTPWNEKNFLSEFNQKINLDLSKYEKILLSTDTIESQKLTKKIIEIYKNFYFINPFDHLEIDSIFEKKITKYPLHFFSTAVGLALGETENEY